LPIDEDGQMNETDLDKVTASIMNNPSIGPIIYGRLAEGSSFKQPKQRTHHLRKISWGQSKIGYYVMNASTVW